jgi:RIO-like serine/threonine protein kinase
MRNKQANCIKISLALHDMHTGEKTKSKISYVHGDIHGGNIVIDDQNEPHFIDYGKSVKWCSDDPSRKDIVKTIIGKIVDAYE